VTYIWPLASATPDQRLPSQPKSAATAAWPELISQLYSPDLPDFGKLCRQANQNMCTKVLPYPEHVLHRQHPSISTISIVDSSGPFTSDEVRCVALRRRRTTLRGSARRRVYVLHVQTSPNCYAEHTQKEILMSDSKNFICLHFLS